MRKKQVSPPRVSLWERWSLSWVLLLSLTLFPQCNCDYLGGPDGNIQKEKHQENPVEPLKEEESQAEPPAPREETAPPEQTTLDETSPEENPHADGGESRAETGSEETIPETPPEPPPPVKTRSCKTTFRFDGRRQSPQKVALAGEFNQWSKNTNFLKDDDGDQIWEISIQLPAGHHGYKFVLNDNDWILDPNNPEQKYVNKIANSLVRVGDCSKPLLRLVRADAPAGKGTINVEVEYQDGADGHGPDLSSLNFTVNGQTVQGAIFRGGRIRLKLSGLANDRYTFRVKAKDKRGQESNLLYFYTWVEKKTFQWKDAVLYFAFVDRFHNGDTSNDAPMGGVGKIANYQGGDLKGILDKLKAGYFANMGVNALWLSPIYDNVNHPERGFDGRTYTGFHGYWPIASRKIETRYGNWSDLKKLVREAHRQGIRVLVDLASNHVHKEHPYWTNNKSQGWFHAENSCAPRWDRPIECWFDAFLPDIDYRNFDAAQAMIGDAIYWAQEGELDGFRVDAVKHMIQLFTYNLRASLNREVTHGMNEFYMVGETFTGAWKDGAGGIIKKYVDHKQLTGQFDFPIYWEILGTIGRREGFFDFRRLDGVAKEVFDKKFYGAQAIMSNFIGNHDVPRFISHAAGQIGNMFSGDRNKAWDNPPSTPNAEEPYARMQMAFTLLMALPGIPLIYYGDEVALPGETDPDNRRFMKFAGLSQKQSAMLAHVQKVAKLRRKYPALSSNSRRTLFVDAEWYAFLREQGQQKIIVVLRRGGSSSQLGIPVQGILPDGQAVQDLLRGASLTSTQGKIQITLQPNQATYLLLP